MNEKGIARAISGFCPPFLLHSYGNSSLVVTRSRQGRGGVAAAPLKRSLIGYPSPNTQHGHVVKEKKREKMAKLLIRVEAGLKFLARLRFARFLSHFAAA